MKKRLFKIFGLLLLVVALALPFAGTDAKAADKMLEDYFFFSTAIKVKHADYELEDFCMYDNIHRCAILYNKKRRTIRLVDTYQDNTSNRDLLISALNRQHFSVFSTRDSLFDPSSGNTNYETFFRFLYFSALDYRWSTQHDENILEYVVSFDE